MTAYTLITGATGGIGLAFAKVFAVRGHDLILVARNEDRLKKIKRILTSTYGIRVQTISADLAKEHAPKELYHYVKSQGWRVDILINNVGFGDHNCFFDTDWQRQKNMLDINITALTHLTYLFGGEMRKSRRGRILNVASLASFCAGPYMSVYFASKSFVRSFSEAVSEELRPYHVSVTALCPGPVATGFEKNAGLQDSQMFKLLHVSDAAAVARAGYDGMMKGKALVYYGWQTKAANVLARMFPRSITRKAAMFVNGKKERGGRL
ncbi:MAG: SDR family oxidoreductase [Eubacterium sp.]|jgi:hypothetical protein|nr:SDR family oxidoreductase [Eubacterium sp.]